MERTARNVNRRADPLIKWPANFSLESSIALLQELNPVLDLQRAVDVDGETEYLFYAGSAFDVFEIAMPEPASDLLMSSLTRVNRELWSISTDLGDRRCGPHRIERTGSGGLLIRPRSENVEDAAGRFSFAYQGAGAGRQEFEQIMRFVSRWGIVRSELELWEVDFAYLPAGHFDHPDGRRKTDREWWETIPIGTISFADECDLPGAMHIARVEAIVLAGSAFAVIGDLVALEYRIYRRDGVSIERDAFTSPEMPWFEFPKLLRD